MDAGDSIGGISIIQALEYYDIRLKAPSFITGEFINSLNLVMALIIIIYDIMLLWKVKQLKKYNKANA